MTMPQYSNEEFELKLSVLKKCCFSIRALSIWCLDRHEHYKSIISVWLKVLRKICSKRRLRLFYFANDVILLSICMKNKFIVGWASGFQKAIFYVRDETVQSKVLKIINSWKELVIYDHNYLAGLTDMLSTSTHRFTSIVPVQKFQVQKLEYEIYSCGIMKESTDFKMKTLEEVKFPFANDEAIQNMLQERTPSHTFINELDDGVTKIKSYINSLKREIDSRSQLLNKLKEALSYNDNKNKEVETTAQAYSNYMEQVIYQMNKMAPLLISMSTNNQMVSADINLPSSSTSVLSVEDLSVHNKNVDNISNTDKYLKNSFMENSNNNNDVFVSSTVVTNIKSCSEPVLYNAVKELYGPTVENQSKSTNLISYDAPLQLPNDKIVAFSEFPNQTNISYCNEVNNHNNSITYSTNNYKADVPTPISSNQQYIASKISKFSSSDSSSLVNEDSVPMAHIQPTALNKTLDNWSTNDTPASPPPDEQIPHRDTPIININDRGPYIDYSALETKMQDKDERMIVQNMISITSNSNYRNEIGLTHSCHINSPTISSDIDYQTFSSTPLPPSPPDILMEAVNKLSNDNIMTNDALASPDNYDKFSNQNTPIIGRTDGAYYIDHSAVATNMQDKDERITQIMINKTSDVDYRNFTSSTYSPHIHLPTVSSNINNRAFSYIPIQPSPSVFKPNNNFESVDMNLNDDCRQPKSNLHQNYLVHLHSPLSLPMSFNLNNQIVPGIINQWGQSSQKWIDKRSSFHDNQWNTEQDQQKQPSEHWKHSNQWIPKSNDLNFVYNQCPSQWPRHDPRDQL